MPKYSKVTLILIILCYSLAGFCRTKIKNLVTVEGQRPNILVGHGLVVGLNGSGDNLKNSIFTQKALTDFLEKLGTNVQGSNLKTKNIAMVIATTELPAFARAGNRIDIKVSAIGDCKSLQGGTLIATPMLGADGHVYAIAQGKISVPDFIPSSDKIKTRIENVQTYGIVTNGGIIEVPLDFDLKNLSKIHLALYNPDFSTASLISDAINSHIVGKVAKALDSATIEVIIPKNRKNDMVAFLAEIESLEVTPENKAAIVINNTTGTIIIGSDTKIRPVAISHGNISINVAGRQYISAKLTDFEDARRGGKMVELAECANVQDLVTGLNKLGVYTKDIANILYEMKSVGAIDAYIEVK